MIRDDRQLQSSSAVLLSWDVAFSASIFLRRKQAGQANDRLASSFRNVFSDVSQVRTKATKFVNSQGIRVNSHPESKRSPTTVNSYKFHEQLNTMGWDELDSY